MARGIDFERLYQEFGLEPGASLDELKLAYRRRVSVLHPDRMNAEDRISQHLANEHLSRLTLMYEAAVSFHRQHGRLPGAAPTASAHSSGRVHVSSASTLGATGFSEPVASRSIGWWIVGVIMIALLAWLIAGLDAFEDSIAPTPANHIRASVPAPAASAGAEPSLTGIHVGMRADDVLRIQGEPLSRNEYRWDYGPSWIGFHKGKVRDWYSSPLRALRIAREPVPENDDAKAKARP